MTLNIDLFRTWKRHGKVEHCVSTTANVPYREMANHCEMLMMGKQQMMSALMSAQEQHDSSFTVVTSEERQPSHMGVDKIQEVQNSL